MKKQAAKSAMSGSRRPLSPELGPVANQLGYLLRRALAVVVRDFTSSASASELNPSEFSALSIINRNPELRQSELASILAIKPPNCAALITRLEQRGLVKRTKLPVSGRAVSLSLTKEGARVCNRYAQLSEVTRKAAGERIGKKETEELIRLLTLLIETE